MIVIIQDTACCGDGRRCWNIIELRWYSAHRLPLMRLHYGRADAAYLLIALADFEPGCTQAAHTYRHGAADNAHFSRRFLARELPLLRRDFNFPDYRYDDREWFLIPFMLHYFYFQHLLAFRHFLVSLFRNSYLADFATILRYDAISALLSLLIYRRFIISLARAPVSFGRNNIMLIYFMIMIRVYFYLFSLIS